MAGFIIAKSQLSAGYTGQLTPVLVKSTSANLTIGEFVEPGVAGSQGIPYVQRLTGTGESKSIVGLVCGFDFDVNNLTSVGFTGGGPDRVAYLAIDPNLLFEGDVSGAILTPANIGHGFNVAVGSVTVSGGLMLPGMLVNSTAPTETVVTNLRITDILTGSDGVFGSRVQFRINYSSQQLGTKSWVDPS